jgi:hypothetical protein
MFLQDSPFSQFVGARVGKGASLSIFRYFCIILNIFLALFVGREKFSVCVTGSDFQENPIPTRYISLLQYSVLRTNNINAA